jgi:hypothetical protein
MEMRQETINLKNKKKIITRKGKNKANNGTATVKRADHAFTLSSTKSYGTVEAAPATDILCTT